MKHTIQIEETKTIKKFQFRFIVINLNKIQFNFTEETQRFATEFFFRSILGSNFFIRLTGYRSEGVPIVTSSFLIDMKGASGTKLLSDSIVSMERYFGTRHTTSKLNRCLQCFPQCQRINGGRNKRISSTQRIDNTFGRTSRCRIEWICFIIDGHSSFGSPSTYYLCSEIQNIQFNGQWITRRTQSLTHFSRISVDCARPPLCSSSPSSSHSLCSRTQHRHWPPT